MPRLASRVDKNQKEIVEALRAAGATVQHLHMVGKGCPDILVGIDGRNILMEIKNEIGKLTQDEWEWHTNWRGQACIVYSVGDALKAIGRY